MSLVDGFSKLSSEDGTTAAVIIVAICILTYFIKQPIKNYAVKWALKGTAENPRDKVSITVWIALIPLLLSFIASFFLSFYSVGWVWAKINVYGVLAMTVSIFGSAIGGYEIVDSVYKAIKSQAESIANK